MLALRSFLSLSRLAKSSLRFISQLLLVVFTMSVIAQDNVPCSGEIYELVEPFMGNWEEYTVTADGEVFIGTLKSSKGPDSCTISQRFVSADGSFSYQSFGYIEAATGLWKEVYVFSNGRNSEYQWFRDGTDVIMRRTGGTRKLEYMHQLRLTNITDMSYDVIEEHSRDKGITWEDVELTRIKKVKE